MTPTTDDMTCPFQIYDMLRHYPDVWWCPSRLRRPHSPEGSREVAKGFGKRGKRFRRLGGDVWVLPRSVRTDVRTKHKDLHEHQTFRCFSVFPWVLVGDIGTVSPSSDVQPCSLSLVNRFRSRFESSVPFLLVSLINWSPQFLCLFDLWYKRHPFLSPLHRRSVCLPFL